jgi:xanthine dehydrogenase large subunit
MLALSVWLAIKDAVSAVANHIIEPDLHIPATNEAILLAIEKLRSPLK